MTNFEKIKGKSLKNIFEMFDVQDDEIQENMFLNFIQVIPCRVCPAIDRCTAGMYCVKALKNWLESEVE